jgi:leucyl-tRNA synthetase
LSPRGRRALRVDGLQRRFDACAWPIHEEAKLRRDEVEMAIQVNGKLRQTLKVTVDIEEEVLKALVLEDATVRRFLEDKPIRRWVIVKNKIVNIVI